MTARLSNPGVPHLRTVCFCPANDRAITHRTHGVVQDQTLLSLPRQGDRCHGGLGGSEGRVGISPPSPVTSRLPESTRNVLNTPQCLCKGHPLCPTCAPLPRASSIGQCHTYSPRLSSWGTSSGTTPSVRRDRGAPSFSVLPSCLASYFSYHSGHGK